MCKSIETAISCRLAGLRADLRVLASGWILVFAALGLDWRRDLRWNLLEPQAIGAGVVYGLEAHAGPVAVERASRRWLPI